MKHVTFLFYYTRNLTTCLARSSSPVAKGHARTRTCRPERVRSTLVMGRSSLSTAASEAEWKTNNSALSACPRLPPSLWPSHLPHFFKVSQQPLRRLAQIVFSQTSPRTLCKNVANENRRRRTDSRAAASPEVLAVWQTLL